MEDRIAKLKHQVQELLDWKKQNAIQQIPFNPPVNTTRIMQEGMLVTDGKVDDSLVIAFDTSLEVSFDGDIVWLPVKKQL